MTNRHNVPRQLLALYIQSMARRQIIVCKEVVRDSSIISLSAGCML